MESQKPNTKDDDLDLSQVMQWIRSGFINLGVSFIRLLAILRRVPLENRFSFVGTVAVSMSLAVAYSFLLKKNYYESSMILSSVYLNKRLVDNTVKKLDALAGEREKKELARLFNMPDSVAQHILGFEARPFVSENDIIETEILKEQLRNVVTEGAKAKVIEQVVERIEIENRRSFEITVRTLTPSVIPQLEESIVGYFRNNDYVKRRIEITKSNLLERKEKLTDELRKLDSLKFALLQNYKNMAEQSREGSNNVILSDRSVTNPVEIYNQDLALYDDLQEVNRQLYLQPDFEVVDSFTEFSEPASAGLFKLLLYATLLGILVAYLEVAARSLNNYLAQVK